MWYGCRWRLAGCVRLCMSVRYAGSGGDATERILQLLSTMPRERQHVPAAQRQRAHIAERADKFSAGSAYLQVLGAGAPNTLYLFTDQKRYLFNCGEGTQRLAHEHKVRLSRLEHVFITSKTWRHLGGLPGVSLTLQDVGVPKITLHGPPGLDELYPATRRFVIMKDMEVSMAPSSPLKDFEDNVMTVKYVRIGPDEDVSESNAAPGSKGVQDEAMQRLPEFEDDDIDYYCAESGQRSNASHTNSPTKRMSPELTTDTSKSKMEQLLSGLGSKRKCSVSYICTMKRRYGTLDLAKCVERGVKPGPLLGLLKQGKDVLLEDGRLVMSADVKTPDELGPVFIVLDVPDIAHLKESDFKEHFDDGTNPPENIPSVIAHFTPQHIVDDARYRSFLRKFGPSTEHLLANRDGGAGSAAVHRAQHKLHLLHPEIFPLLSDRSLPLLWNPPAPAHCDELQYKIAQAQYDSIINNTVNKFPASSHSESKEASTGDTTDVKQNELVFHNASTLTMFQLRPKRVWDRSAELTLDIQEYISETMQVEGFTESLDQFRQLVETRAAAAAPPAPFPRVVFLGTGSCIPNKTRNTSAILLHLDDTRSMLLDCGEGTYGQLVRFYGTERVRSVLASLRAIYISHLHADHHIGLIGVLQGRRQALNELRSELTSEDSCADLEPPLYLLAPGQIMTWLSIYDQQFEKIRSEFQIVPNQALLQNPPAHTAGMVSSAMVASMGLRSVRTCQVLHCPNSFGVCVELPSGERITYSGDTMPCDELVALGADSTLLIHEATMEDELAAEARAKKHSTTSQAISVGRSMRAKHTLLTHFSQRYARLPRLSDNLLSSSNGVGIAFDNMQVRMGDLDILPHMYPPLQLMFAEHCVELEQRAAKRAQKRELRSRSASPAHKSTLRALTQHNSARKYSQRPHEDEGCGDVARVSEQISYLNSGEES